jgi:hypothetical protein
MEPKADQENEYLDTGGTSFLGLINELNEIRGYRAAAILTYDGELLYSNATEQVDKFDLGVLIDVYNGLFGHACGLSEKSGFVSCNEVSLRSGQEIIVIRCSGKDCLVGIRLLVMIEEQGNIPLLHRQLGKLLPRLMQCLTWEPDNLVPLYMLENAWRRKSEKISQDN